MIMPIIMIIRRIIIVIIQYDKSILYYDYDIRGPRHGLPAPISPGGLALRNLLAAGGSYYE